MSSGEEEGYWASREIVSHLFRRSKIERKQVTQCEHNNELILEVPTGSQVVVESVTFPCGCFARIRPDIS